MPESWEERERAKYDRIWREKGGSYSDNSPEVTALAHRLPGNFPFAGRWLVVGGGMGAGYRWLTKKFGGGVVDVKVCDISGEVEKSYPPGVFTRCAAHALPYKDNEFHRVLCVDVIEHMPESAVPLALQEMSRVCIDNGPSIIVQARCAASVFEPDLHLTVKPHNWWLDIFQANLGGIEYTLSDSLDILVIAKKRIQQ